MVATLFQRGKFDALAAAKTAYALRGYGVGLVGLIGVKILAPGFYARQDIRTPVTIAVIVLALTQAMNAVFVPLFGHAGLALSVSLGATINAVWLFVGLKRGGWYQPAPGWGRFALKVVFATLAMSALLAVAAVNIDWLGLAGRDARARRLARRLPGRRRRRLFRRPARRRDAAARLLAPRLRRSRACATPGARL